MRLLETLEYERAHAFGRLLRRGVGQPESSLGVELGIRVGQPQAAPGDLADPPPPARDDLKYFTKHLLGGLVAVAAHRPAPRARKTATREGRR